MQKPMSRSTSLIRQAVAWSVILCAVGLLAVCVVVPRLAGATPYTILTGSMRPTFPPGTLVVVKPTPFDQIDIGDAVTFQLKSGRPDVVTHRVIGQTVDANGRPALITQGDNNPSPDAKHVIEKQVKGTVWYSAPHLGRVSSLLSSAQRHLVLSAVVIGLLGYAAFMFIGAARDRTRSRRRPDHRQEAR